MAVLTQTESGLEPLRRAVGGGVIAPGDHGWEVARQAWNLAAVQRPAAVVQAAGVDDVIATVRFARARGLAIAPQGTGHGASALGSLDDALLLKTARMGSVRIDPQRRTARAAAGALWGDVALAAGEFGLAALAGSSPDVGVVGYTLGGGAGWLARRHGLACNSVRWIEIVLADGTLVRTDREHEPELFWALRGGAGGLGVVTALEFDLYPLAEVFGGLIAWPAERAAEILDRYRRWTPALPDALSSSLRLMNLPPAPSVPEPLRGRGVVMVDAAYLGGARRGEQLLQPLRAIPGALADTFAMMPATALSRLHGDPEQPTAGIGDGLILAQLGPDAAAAFLSIAGPGSGSPLVVAELRQLGGALRSGPPGHGALAGVEGDFALYAVGAPGEATPPAAIRAHLREVARVMRPWTAPRSFLNLADGLPDTAAAFQPAVYRRLQAAKRRYDPADLFRSNHPVAPLGRDS
jgi:FAD/FMN-containing dehydrogenase